MEGRSIGLDVHRDFCEVAICDGDEVRRAPRVAARPEALMQFAAQLGPQDRVALEATGNALAIARIVRPHVKEVVIVNTRRLKAISEAKHKTDRRDARMLAFVLLDGCWQPDEQARALRRRVARRARLVTHRSRCRSSLCCTGNLKARPPMTAPSGATGAYGSPSRGCRPTSATRSTPRCAKSTSSPKRSQRRA
jgi:transposase